MDKPIAVDIKISCLYNEAGLDEVNHTPNAVSMKVKIRSQIRISSSNFNVKPDTAGTQPRPVCYCCSCRHAGTQL